MPSAALAEARSELANRLREDLPEIERTIATRVYAIADPRETADPEYLQGLRTALPSAVELFLATIERGERRCPDVPAPLLAQARMAARNGIGLDTVLRRYVAGYSLLVEFALRAEEASWVASEPGGRLLHGPAAVFDRLIEAVCEEHTRESARQIRSSRGRRAERVRRLLAGESIDADELEYELGGFHIGLVATDLAAEPAVRALASRLEMRLLWVPAEEDRAWAWLGKRRRLSAEDAARVRDLAEGALPPDTRLALGEPAEGAHGWRLTHRQALAALSLARRLPARILRYAEVGLLACVSNDELLRESLRQMYLEPLCEEPDGGEAMRRTLRAYLAAGRNVSSAAAALEVNRQTVSKRVRAFEQKVSQSIDDCAAALQVALELEHHTPAGHTQEPTM